MRLFAQVSTDRLLPVRQIRDAVGNDMEIGIECHFRWNRASIERIARALEPYDILFLEDVMAAPYMDEIRQFFLRQRRCHGQQQHDYE